MKLLTVGISGASCSGKTSVASKLEKMLPWCSVINQDKYYHGEDSCHHVRSGNLINWEVLEAFDMKRMKVRRNRGTGRNVKCRPCRPISCRLFFAAEPGCPAAEQCDDLMGVTNDLSGQRTDERTDDFFCPLLSDRGRDVALNVCTF